ncbi:MAG: LamG domain-containing protein, partial [Betaproteobacteria bacterium]|nr:LamG domain-containing protein [Betaproteobacteria bacterium]
MGWWNCFWYTKSSRYSWFYFYQKFGVVVSSLRADKHLRLEMLSRLSSFSGPLSTVFRKQNATNLILDLQTTVGLSALTWQDQSVYNNDATLYGSIATASISNGTVVLSLDGINDYIFATAGFANKLDTGLTYEVWASPGTSSNGTLLSEWSGNPPTGWNDAQMGFVSNKINAGVYSSNLSSYITGPTFSVNNWYNIVMTYDHQTNIVSLYINGSLFSTTTTTKLNPPSTYLTLGRTDTANTYLGGLSGYFKGYIGLWRIWDGALNSTQILQNYNDFKSTYSP